jgi:phosphate-selective porin O/P
MHRIRLASGIANDTSDSKGDGAMKTIGLMTAVATLTAAPVAFGAEVIKTEAATVDVGGRLEASGIIQQLDDPFRNDTRMYMFLKQARLLMAGNIADTRFKIQVGFANEDEAKAPSPGVSIGLLDMYVDIPIKALGQNNFIRVGQYKVPFGLERLSDPQTINFGDRSISNLALRVGRDMGATFHGKLGDFYGIAGVFTGGGRDVPERYLPEVLGVPMLSARFGYDNGLYANGFADQNKGLTGTRYAVNVNGIYLIDSSIGHSTVLNVKLGERSLLTNTNWNPYIAQAPFSVGTQMQAGIDGAFRAPVGPGAVRAEAEADWGRYSNAYGQVSLGSVRAQAGYQWSFLEGDVRYGLVLPSNHLTTKGVSITGTDAIQEVTPSLTMRFNAPGAPRLTADLPILIGVPVITEAGLGNYVATEQPDQVSIISAPGNTIARQNVVEARLMFEAQF